MPLTDRAQARAAALQAAAVLHGPLTLLPGVDRQVSERAVQESIRRLADGLAAYVFGTTRIHLTHGLVVDEASGIPAETSEGENMQLNTGQQVTYTADTEDAAGYDTVENIEWSIAPESAATLSVSEDTRSCTVVSGAPGSAVLTARITSLGLEVTEAIDVVPAGTATIKLVAGDVEDETSAPGEGDASEGEQA
ncbi:hypothetical protein OIE13_22240 [Streptosporangium sp. NBC_01810]|uniref:hypothetical protein n=1 Tax=Streptosporangium sp. NBC_01810 TaxID=2975951 RepID=UPI002DD92B3D|nr:hypothetical protein [Streptosporangium sp. NBC_01810]WSA23663.1 hypothetical protein OIE13_22240 [Streptosporangium sp. NBC_01810]